MLKVPEIGGLGWPAGSEVFGQAEGSKSIRLIENKKSRAAIEAALLFF
jgi:hypothetical protein